MGNEYFKRTKKKLVGTPELIKSLTNGEEFTHFFHKFDGTHAELIISDDVQFITRDGKDITHLVPYLVEQLKQWEYMEAYRGVYACELFHVERFYNEPKDVWSASRRVLGKKLYDSELPQIDCIIYDVHEREYKEGIGEIGTHIVRGLELPRADYSEDILGEVFGLSRFYTPRARAISELEVTWNHHILEMKREGFVLTNIYKETDWDKTFTKLKPLIDVDCVVIGYNLGTVGTKNAGKVGSLQVAVYHEGELRDIGKIPHMTDEEREMWTQRMYRGKLEDDSEGYVLEVECAEVTVKGKLRFPNYVRERQDKSRYACLWSQLC